MANDQEKPVSKVAPLKTILMASRMIHTDHLSLIKEVDRCRRANPTFNEICIKMVRI